MIFFRALSFVFIWLGFMLLPAFSLAESPEDALHALYADQSITSVERANAALKDVVPARVLIERRSANEEAECYEHFIVSSCLSEVRAKRRKSMAVIRKVEVEANAFLRKEKADGRDKAVAERQAKAEQEGGHSIPISGAAREASPEALDK